ncbi:hypothetical protein [Burkholderia sp. 3C]
MSDKPTLADLAAIYGESRALEMLDAPTLPAIRNALSAAPAVIVDRPVAHQCEIFAATSGLALPLYRRAYLDVPLVKIFALSHKSFAEKAKTWRSLLDGIHGIGWEHDALDYFESEIGASPFPVPEAARPLRMQAFGGVLICTNGMHRLVAAVCWLAAKDGENARLRKVEVLYSPVNQAALRVIAEALDAGARVDAARPQGTLIVYLRTHSRGLTKYWAAEGRHVRPISALGGWLSCLRRQIKEPDAKEAGLDWQPVSRELVEALADTRWLREQHRAPSYAEKPA